MLSPTKSSAAQASGPVRISAVWAGIRSHPPRVEELLLALLSKKSATFDTPSALVLQNTDLSAAGSTDAFLSSRLRFVKDAYGQDICEVEADGEPVGVMMGWEREISE